MWKKLLITLALSLSLIATSAFADELGIGGVLVDGHSDTGSYGMNNEGAQSWGIMSHFDKDKGWKKQISTNSAVGIDPGLAYMYFRWTKNHNLTRTKERHIQKYTREENVNSHIVAITLKPYLEIYKDFRLFTVGGMGWEFADDDGDDMTVMGGVGMQYMFTKNFGTSLSQYVVYTDPTGNYRRFDATVLSIDFRF
jgi:hypothetical protein